LPAARLLPPQGVCRINTAVVLHPFFSYLLPTLAAPHRNFYYPYHTSAALHQVFIGRVRAVSVMFPGFFSFLSLWVVPAPDTFLPMKNPAGQLPHQPPTPELILCYNALFL